MCSEDIAEFTHDVCMVALPLVNSSPTSWQASFPGLSSRGSYPLGSGFGLPCLCLSVSLASFRASVDNHLSNDLCFFTGTASLLLTGILSPYLCLSLPFLSVLLGFYPSCCPKAALCQTEQSNPQASGASPLEPLGIRAAIFFCLRRQVFPGIQVSAPICLFQEFA